MPTSTSSSPIFILSCERAGSTLLRYIVDTHPDICSPGEINLGGLARHLGLVIGRTLALTSLMDTPTDERQFVAREARRIISDIMDRYSKEKGKKIWCDKTPINVQNTDALERTFPDARYICLHRHCLDVVHSCLEVSRHGFMMELVEYVRRKPQNLTEAMIESWLDKTQRILAFEAKNAKRCFRVKYEDIIGSPERSLRQMFEFIGVSWVPSILDTVFSVQHDVGGGDRSIESTRKIESDRVGKGITSIVRAHISEDCFERMNRTLQMLGYAVVKRDEFSA